MSVDVETEIISVAMEQFVFRGKSQMMRKPKRIEGNQYKKYQEAAYYYTEFMLEALVLGADDEKWMSERDEYRSEVAALSAMFDKHGITDAHYLDTFRKFNNIAVPAETA